MYKNLCALDYYQYYIGGSNYMTNISHFHWQVNLAILHAYCYLNKHLHASYTWSSRIFEFNWLASNSWSEWFSHGNCGTYYFLRWPRRAIPFCILLKLHFVNLHFHKVIILQTCIFLILHFFKLVFCQFCIFANQAFFQQH